MVVAISTSADILGSSAFSNLSLTTTPPGVLGLPELDDQTLTAILFSEEKSTGSSNCKNDPAHVSAPAVFIA